MPLTYGSLFSGVGGLEMGVQTVLPGETLWHSDIDPGACKVLAHRWPDVPNLGDITTIDWANVPRVDVLTGGSPCQDVSSAGKRAGMTEGTRSNLWVAMRDAIDHLRPSLVVWENVRGALSARAASDLESREGRVGETGEPALRAVGRVLGDLADLGYDAVWVGLRAADVGAPHGRFRIFVFAAPADSPRLGHERPWTARVGRPGPADGCHAATDAHSRGHGGTEDAGGVGCLDGSHEGRAWERQWARGVTERGSAATPPDSDMPGRGSIGRFDSLRRAPDGRRRTHRLRPHSEPSAWGPYAAAVARWEHVLGRPAPDPTEPAPRGGHRLNTEFASWLMGYPEGHITDTPGITRNESLKCAGNGVVPQQAAEATRRAIHHIKAAS